jgi:hypothetical protein
MDPVYAGKLARDPDAHDSLPERNVLVRLVLYQEGRRVLARTMRPAPEEFAASPSSGAVRAGAARVRIEESAQERTYLVEVEPGTRLTFRGPPGRPAASQPATGPVWDLTSLDLKVDGEVEIGTAGSSRRLAFDGRGVHDHGFGPDAAAPAVRSWAWGWAHAWEFAVAWRQVELETGAVDTLLVVDRAGEPLLAEPVRSRPFRARYSLLGIPYRRQWRLDAPSGAGLAVERLRTLGSSPIGMRFLSNIRFSVLEPPPRMRLVDGAGMSSVARPQRAQVRPLRWLARAREIWTSGARA